MSTQALEYRYDFVFLYDVQDGNPNGDPDAGNTPRIDFQTGQGLITDVCLNIRLDHFLFVQLIPIKNARTNPSVLLNYSIYLILYALKAVSFPLVQLRPRWYPVINHKKVKSLLSLFTVDSREKHTTGLNSHHSSWRKVGNGNKCLSN